MLGYDGIPECYYASGVKYDEVNALTEKAIETRNAFMLATTAKQRATGFELPVCLRATETAPPDELCSMLPATTSLAIGTRDVGTHARDTSEASEDYACYICLDESGPMLVNVCACRSMRVHSHCLMELVRRDVIAQTHASHKPRCSVCREELKIFTTEETAAGTNVAAKSIARSNDERCSTWFCSTLGCFNTALGVFMCFWGMTWWHESSAYMLLAITGLILASYSAYSVRKELEGQPSTSARSLVHPVA